MLACTCDVNSIRNLPDLHLLPLQEASTDNKGLIELLATRDDSTVSFQVPTPGMIG